MRFLRNAVIAAVFALPLFAADAPGPEAWSLDRTHSSVEFKIRHLMANVTGAFRDFDAVLNLDRANPAGSSVEFTIKTASVDTGNDNRDEHLRSADFFDVEKTPAITFKSVSIRPKSATEFDVTGDFTMRGVTRRITLPVTFLGFGKDARGNQRGGFEIETTLNRKDYGIEWNRTFDGGVLLGDDVKVMISLSVVKKAPEAPKPAA